MSVVYDGIIGLVIGDILGVPFEFQARDSFKAVDMVGYGTHKKPIGTWSDDTSLTLATIESIVRLGKIEPNDIMENFLKWYEKAIFTSGGEVFDIGASTATAIKNYKNGTDAVKCGGSKERDNGNGSLMRILPLVFIMYTKKDIENISSLTHSHKISVQACEIYVKVAEILISSKKTKDIAKFLKNSKDNLLPEFNRLPTIYELKRNEIYSGGYVVDTLEAALWCVFKTHSYKECVLTAVNLGDDTDTTAAVAGGLAGILYGCNNKNGIPDKWISQIKHNENINELCYKFQKNFLVRLQVMIRKFM